MSNGEAEHEPPTDAQPSPEVPAAGKSVTPQAAKAPVTQGGAVPKKAAEDDPRAWGDAELEGDRDAWLREQRPPHWA
jgi:hypothetical protein